MFLPWISFAQWNNDVITVRGKRVFRRRIKWNYRWTPFIKLSFHYMTP